MTLTTASLTGLSAFCWAPQLVMLSVPPTNSVHHAARS